MFTCSIVAMATTARCSNLIRSGCSSPRRPPVSPTRPALQWMQTPICTSPSGATDCSGSRPLALSAPSPL
jgi:hypothetical protein